MTDVRYQMASGDFGFKKGGFALEGDYFLRRVDDIRGVGLESLAFDHLVDEGVQAQLSTMLQPKEAAGLRRRLEDLRRLRESLGREAGAQLVPGAARRPCA